jgi:5'-nucleotidase
MRYLLTNDDGIYARGIDALYQELSQDAECLVVAPELEQSAVGHAITLLRPLMVREVKKNGSIFGYAVSGTPADCVKLGIRELSPGPVNLVVSGVNRGANVGINVLYSGTVSAATEGAILGVPAMAVSLDTHREVDYSVAAKFARRLASWMMKNDLGRDVALNVNVPALAENEIKGVVIARQGRARLMESFERRVDPREHVYYWLSGETQLSLDEDLHSDACALKQGMITITPINYDLTCHRTLKNLEGITDQLEF